MASVHSLLLLTPRSRSRSAAVSELKHFCWVCADSFILEKKKDCKFYRRSSQLNGPSSHSLPPSDGMADWSHSSWIWCLSYTSKWKSALLKSMQDVIYWKKAFCLRKQYKWSNMQRFVPAVILHDRPAFFVWLNQPHCKFFLFGLL